MYTENS